MAPRAAGVLKSGATVKTQATSGPNCAWHLRFNLPARCGFPPMTLFIFAVLLLCALSAMVLWPVLTLAALPLTGVALVLVVAVAGGIGVPALLLSRRRPQRSAQHVSLAAE